MRAILMSLTSFLIISLILGCSEGRRSTSRVKRGTGSVMSAGRSHSVGTLLSKGVGYQVINENNLFLPLGWKKESNPKVKEVRPESPPPPRNELKPPPSGLLTLTGIIRNGAEWIALIEDTRLGEGYFLRRGDSVKGFLVGEIFPDYVLLTKGEKEISLSLGEAVGYEVSSAELPLFREPVGKVEEEKKGGGLEDIIERMKARRRRELGE